MGNTEVNKRLKQLKDQQFLTKRIFGRISENLHYEIFKFLNAEELLEIRGINLGGFQLTSNPLLRSRIKNYLIGLKYNILSTNKINDIQNLFVQQGDNRLSFEGIILYNKQISKLNKMMKNTKLHLQINELNLKLSMIGQKEILKLSSKLGIMPSFICINLEGNMIGEKGVKALFSNLQWIAHLQKLNLRRNCIEDAGAKYLVENFKNLPHLLDLDLNNNNITNQARSSIVFENLHLIPNLESFCYDFVSYFQADSCPEITNNWKYLSKARSLDLTINNEVIMQGLCANAKLISKLEKFKLNFNHYLADNVINFQTQLIGETLLKMSKLKDLSFAGNNNLNEQIEGIAKSFESLPNLESLNLNGCLLYNYMGIEQISNNIKFLPKLRILKLGKNRISDDSTKHIAQSFNWTPKLENLDLLDNLMGDNGIQYIAQNLKAIPNLRLLDLGLNKITNSGAAVLALNLYLIPKLKMLNLGINRIEDLGTKDLMANFIFIANLKEFGFRANKITETVEQQLKVCAQERRFKLDI